MLTRPLSNTGKRLAILRRQQPSRCVRHSRQEKPPHRPLAHLPPTCHSFQTKLRRDITSWRAEMSIHGATAVDDGRGRLAGPDAVEPPPWSQQSYTSLFTDPEKPFGYAWTEYDPASENEQVRPRAGASCRRRGPDAPRIPTIVDQAPEADSGIWGNPPLYRPRRLDDPPPYT